MVIILASNFTVYRLAFCVLLADFLRYCVVGRSFCFRRTIYLSYRNTISILWLTYLHLNLYPKATPIR